MYVLGAILIGFVASVLAGMFGVGGAGVTTPANRVILGASPAVSLGTTLPAVIPTALTGAYTYYRNGFLDSRVALYASASGVAGSVGGAYLTKVVDLHYLMLVTGVIVLYLAVLTIVRAWKSFPVAAEQPAVLDETGLPGEAPGQQERRASVLRLLAVGLGGGFVSGLLGVGGGIVLIPAFLYLLHLPIKKAFGTSLAVVAVIAIPGTIVHALLGHISGWLFLFLTIGVIPGAYLGARISIGARERFLYAGFGIVLGAFGVLFIVNEIISMITHHAL